MGKVGAAEASEELRGRLQWFLFGRVVVASFFLVGLLLHSRAVGGVYGVRHLTYAVVGTYGFSIISAVVLHRVRRLNLYTHAQIIFDVLLVTGMVFMTGGVESPFPFLYSLPIINGAGLLLTEGAAVGAIASIIAYSALVLGTATEWIPRSYIFGQPQFDLQSSLRFFSNNVTFALVGLLATILTRRLYSMEILIRERQGERDRLIVLQEAIGRTIGSGLIVTDPSGKITSVDETAAAMVRMAATDMIGHDIGETFPPLQLTVSARRRFLQSHDKMDPIEFTHQAPEQPPIHIRCATDLLRDTYGNPIGVLNVLQDITRLKEIDEQQTPTQQIEALFREDLEAAAEIAEESDGLYGISSAINKIRQVIDRVAKSDATVLISGESGTGKELVARAIHARSARRQKPFVAVNCGAIPENLIESEFFGHVKGAFTGAIADRPGCFRAADGGSIFLDEIGELSLHLQVKLLRVLQERVFRPVGSETNVAVNVRVIAASNRNLAAEVKAGRFREDLFYRLNVIAIDVPPLRDRREDIPLLARHFLRQFADMHHRNVMKISPTATRRILEYGFPGNVRELENVIEHAIALCDGDTIEEQHLPEYLRDAATPGPATAQNRVTALNLPKRLLNGINLDADVADYEKNIILQALEQSGGVRKRAAELLGINYRSLRHRLQKYGISSGERDGDEE